MRANKLLPILFGVVSQFGDMPVVAGCEGLESQAPIIIQEDDSDSIHYVFSGESTAGVMFSELFRLVKDNGDLDFCCSTNTFRMHREVTGVEIMTDGKGEQWAVLTVEGDAGEEVNNG